MNSYNLDRNKASPNLDILQPTANKSTSIRSVSTERLDAGLRSLDHCACSLSRHSTFSAFSLHFSTLSLLPFLLIQYLDKNKLPLWRYSPRQKLIPFVRWETPYLALMQDSMRSSALDTYFSITANLGTHTFFMVFLPMLFWCGYTDLGRGYD